MLLMQFIVQMLHRNERLLAGIAAVGRDQIEFVAAFADDARIVPLDAVKKENGGRDMKIRLPESIAFRQPQYILEQGTGIEPASVAWEATVLPMN